MGRSIAPVFVRGNPGMSFASSVAAFTGMSPLLFGLATLAVLAGAIVQGSSGVGLGLVAAPVLIMIDPSIGPGPLLVLALLLSLVMVFREFGSIDRWGLAWSMVGRVLGSAIAGVIYALLPLSVYELLFGLMIMGAVFLSVAGFRAKQTTFNMISAGFTSGVMGTLTSAGSPAMALIYQRSEGATIRATLSAYFLLSSAVSIIVLIVVGKFGLPQVTASLAFIPVVMIGFWLSNFVVKRVDNARMRVMVLTVSSVAALALIARAIAKMV